LRIINHTQNTVLADRAALADTFLSRLRGLLGRTSLPDGEALIITRCNSIHMFFMHFPIDVVFIDKKDIVVGLLEKFPPNSISPLFWRSFMAIELSAGRIALTKTRINDKIRIVE
jgi:uncharacterized membrane protein (UPF0127 family)